MPLRALKSLPAAVRAALPRGGVTLFCGVVPIGLRGGAALLHVYTKGSNNDAFLDVFGPAQSGRSARGRGGWRKLSTVRLGAATADEFKLQVRWLRPAQKRSPVLVATLAGGGSGQHRVLTFARGVGGAVSSDTFEGSSSLHAVTSYDFDALDARGLMAVRETAAEYNGEAGPGDQKVTLFRWNGHHFAARP